ncbi:MAG: Flp pilus assembly complex ATPase component TadA [Planctomycetes bacterium]|nr:Flp pilus assembly complex ATPase component TadA [Planctomycetota bacterium]MBI3836155.1 Flp pilus assembly complex ATPase component TadA [Planctomycetota bacterium]
MPPVEQLRGRQLGRVLIKMNKLRRQQLDEALEIQKQRRGPLGSILVELGHISEDELNIALASQAGIGTVDLSKQDIAPEVIAVLTATMATTYRVIPYELDKDRKTLSIALDNPDNFVATDDLKTLLDLKNIKAALCTPAEMQTALDRYYPEGEQESITGLISELAEDEDLAKFQGRGDSIDLAEVKEMMEANPVKKLLNLVLMQAIKEKASDVHFEPFEDEFKMRYRIDGVLYEMVPPPRYVAMAISSRIKVMANLDIAERRLPQDGRIELQLRGRPIDLRVSVLPTMFGESVVLRVLDRSNVQLSLEKIGMRDDDLNLFRQLMGKPNGIIINTGPTGSGKTTTLYAALSELNDPEVKILTAEDPVEYDIDGLVQTQVRPEVGLTFGRCLRSFLRQDPDIILVGEVRDLETAQISVQASLTGHLVFTTLHTNDAPSAIARLLDLGMEPFLITATIEAIVAQRLVRRICTNCKTDYRPTEEQIMELNLKPEDVGDRVFYYGKGCDYCNNTGYRGRLGIYEIMSLDDNMRDMIMNRASTDVLRRQAVKRGMRTLRESGIMAIFEGVTSLDEVVRETIVEE